MSAMITAQPRDRSPPCSVTPLAVHNLAQRLPVEMAADIVREKLGDPAVTLGMKAADMGQNPDSGRLPEGIIGRQRLRAEHIQYGTGDRLGLDGGDEVLVHDDGAAREVYEPGRRLHFRNLRLV